MSNVQVILVDEKDMPSGVSEKLTAHTEGLLHRAFSVFIFNHRGEMLLQQRATQKYHSGGLWTNAVCSHPAPGEETNNAVTRRLNEELGFSAPVKKIFDFIYRAELDNGLTEYEFDHVFAGEYDGPVNFNTDEVMNIEFKHVSTIKDLIDRHPGMFTAWFLIAFPKVKEWWMKEYSERSVNH